MAGGAATAALVEAATAAKLLVAEQLARRQAAAGATGEHWSFAYAILRRVSRSFALLIHQLAPAELRNAVCVFYLVLRALDTVGGTEDYKVLMDNFHNISTAFLEIHPG